MNTQCSGRGQNVDTAAAALTPRAGGGRKRTGSRSLEDDEARRLAERARSGAVAAGPHGAWALTVIFADGGGRSFILLTADGLVIAAPAQRDSGIGVGVWARTGVRAFAYVVRHTLFDAGGMCVGEMRLYHDAVLSSRGETYEAHGDSVGIEPDGRVLFRQQVTTQATRFTI